MKLMAPDFYREFHCIADRCRHSCCIGWEIDIDPETREKWRCVPGAFGARLNAAIDDSGETACFRLGADERCPMLNASGLCDLITELGEGALCQICADHPRFRNFFTDRTEIGPGLCCEEAARLVLTRRTPLTLVTLEDDGADESACEEETALLALRDQLIALVQDGTRPLPARLTEAEALGGLPIPHRDWPAIYRGLERLDPAWDAALDSLADASAAPPEALHPAFANFCAYMLFRHLPGALEDEDVPGRVAFCLLSTRMLMALCAAKPDCTLADCIELARMYSAEIEYSEDNIAALLDALWEEDDPCRNP